jgi:hypothetical protein
MKLTASKLNKFLFLNCRQRLSVVCVSQLLMKTMCICKTPMDQSKPIQFYVFCCSSMAAELATGVMFQIQKSGRKYRCLLLTTKGILQKKATGRITLLAMMGI